MWSSCAFGCIAPIPRYRNMRLSAAPPIALNACFYPMPLAPMRPNVLLATQQLPPHAPTRNYCAAPVPACPRPPSPASHSTPAADGTWPRTWACAAASVLAAGSSERMEAWAWKGKHGMQNIRSRAWTFYTNCAMLSATPAFRPPGCVTCAPYAPLSGAVRTR